MGLSLSQHSPRSISYVGRFSIRSPVAGNSPVQLTGPAVRPSLLRQVYHPAFAAI